MGLERPFKLLPLFIEGIKWTIGTDLWVGSTPLIHMLASESKISLIRLPDNGILISFSSHSSYSSSSSNYTCCYHSLIHTVLIQWHRLWKLPSPPKLNFFLWQILNNKLPTALALYSQFILPNPLCSLCGEIDDIRHCFFHCKVFDNLRLRVDWLDWTHFEFLHFLKKDNNCMHAIQLAKTLFTFSHMWLSRNTAIFRNSSINCTQVIQSTEQSCINYLEANNITTGNKRHLRIQEQISWKPSTVTDFKLNIDGASSVDTGMTSLELLFVIQEGT